MTTDLLLIAAFVVAVGLMLFRGRGQTGSEPAEPLALDETAKGQALLAIKDLEFDHATGKLADGDYRELRDRFVGEAASLLESDQDPAEAFLAERRALLLAGPAVCSQCGPRPEVGANYCSTCGARLR